MKRSRLRRRYGRARQAGWLTATVRTPANDRAADRAYRKAQTEKAALEKSWSYTMSAASQARANGESDEHLQKTAARLSKEADEQGAIIVAAQRYAQLPKAGGG